MPDKLKSVGVNIFSEDYVKEKTKKVLWTKNGIIFENELVAGLPDSDGDKYTDAGSDGCGGDSGGPLVCRKGDSLVMYGLTSWGISCGERGLPGVYAQVFSAMTWVQDTIGIPTTTTTPVILNIKF